jgi:hypothetical protein
MQTDANFVHTGEPVEAKDRAGAWDLRLVGFGTEAAASWNLEMSVSTGTPWLATSQEWQGQESQIEADRFPAKTRSKTLADGMPIEWLEKEVAFSLPIKRWH